MKGRRGAGDVIFCIPLLLVLLPGGAALAQQQQPGAAVYERWCAGCHGSEGKGDGPASAYMLPRPRDFTRAQFQIRTTSTGSLPTDDDILHIIDEGMPGTAMPGWKDLLSERERRDLVAYLKTFSRFFETDRPQPLAFSKAPRADAGMVAEGRRVYEQIECWKCHGQAGRGDGASAPTQEDDSGFPIRPADLTEPWLFNGGSTAEEIFRRLRTGLDGTPMPSFTDAIDAGVITEDQLWAVAHYVRSLGAETPRVRELIRAAPLAELPNAPDDSAWNAIEPFYVPLVGQIIVRPRWFAPTVDGVWVQAAHNGSELALRLSWSDPSDSPDPAWAEWRAAVSRVMAPKEEPAGATGAATGSGGAPDSIAPPGPGGNDVAFPTSVTVPDSPDAIAIWFPREIPSGMERPWFFMGSARDPVYLWYWQSRGEVQELQARGPGRLDPLPGKGALTGEARFHQGQWRVVLRRPLAAASPEALTFLPGQPIPMALFAWDGDNTERGTRGSLSTWYFIQLDEPASGTVFATPILATLLTAGLGIALVVRAQRRERQRTSEPAPTDGLNPSLEA
jgi:mono/diheme cytochrome c family protein